MSSLSCQPCRCAGSELSRNNGTCGSAALSSHAIKLLGSSKSLEFSVSLLAKSRLLCLDRRAYNIPCPSLSFLPEAVDIRSTCNGLLACRSSIGDYSYYICSPATKQWRKLPKPILSHGPNTAITLEFEPRTLSFVEHFQLICAVKLQDKPVLHFEIYSSRSNSWRVSNVTYSELGEVELNGDGFYLKGYVYWETRSGKALAFDVKNEEYGFLSLPPVRNRAGGLSGMSGELSYLQPCRRDGKFAIEVYGGMDMKLKRTVYPKNRTRLPGKCRVLASADEDTVVFSCGNQVVALDARSGLETKLSGCGGSDLSVKYLPYVNSLASVEVAKAEESFLA